MSCLLVVAVAVVKSQIANRKFEICDVMSSGGGGDGGFIFFGPMQNITHGVPRLKQNHLKAKWTNSQQTLETAD